MRISPKKKYKLKKIPKFLKKLEKKRKSPNKILNKLRSRSPVSRSKDEGQVGLALAKSKGRREKIQYIKKNMVKNY